MKKLILVLSILLLIGCKSKNAAVSTVPEIVEMKIVKLGMSEITVGQKSKAYELGKRVLMTCNTSRFKPFTSSEAISFGTMVCFRILEPHVTILLLSVSAV